MAYLSHSELTAGEIALALRHVEASRVAASGCAGKMQVWWQAKSVDNMSTIAWCKSVSQTPLNGYLRQVCPVSRPLKKESAVRAREKKSQSSGD